MARKRKGELPSGNIRKKVYMGKELRVDADGNPILDEKGRPVYKKIYKSVTAETPQEAQELASALKADKVIVCNSTSPNLTVYEKIRAYVELNQSVLSPTTIHGYKACMDFAFQDTIMYMPIRELTKEICQDAINKESVRTTKRTGKPISSKTLKNEWGIVATVLNEEGINFPVKLPKVNMELHELSDPEQIWNANKGTDVELPVLLAMWLSFTMSEIKGLTKSGSLRGEYIYIDKVMVRTDNEDHIKSVGKNSKRNRMAKCPEYILELIEKVDGDVIVPMNQRTIYSHFCNNMRLAGLPKMSFHDLRHVSATVCDSLSIPSKVSQDRGGWSGDGIMRSRYMQTFSSERQEADAVIDSYFSEIITGSKREKASYLYLEWLKQNNLPDTFKSMEKFLLSR